MEALSLWTSLPAELLSEVFLKVPRTSRVGLRLVCASWRQTLDAPSVWLDLNREGAINRFTACCGSGNLEAAQWLAAALALTAKNARANDSRALRQACAHGHLPVARWLAGTFALTAADANAVDSALRHAYRSGHPEIVRWWFAAFELQEGSGPSVQSSASVSSASAGPREGSYHPVAQWLAEKFGLG